MARTSKKQLVTDQVKEIVMPDRLTPKMQSIAFDKNSNLYGISEDNKVYKFDFNKKDWVIV